MSGAQHPMAEFDEPPGGDVILLADSSVEGEDIAMALRAQGFTVFDVPLGLLEARVASERSRVVIIDVDQPGAVERARRIRDYGVGPTVEILCVGDPLRAAELADLDLNDLFERPVDLKRLVARVSGLATPGFLARGTTPPPMYAPRPSAPPGPDSVPPPSEPPRPGDPRELGGYLQDAEESSATLGLLADGVRLSPELAARIAAAEARVRGELEAQPTAPESAPDRPLPAELLAFLAEPLDGADDLASSASESGSQGSNLSALPGTGGGPSSALTPNPRLGPGIGLPIHMASHVNSGAGVPSGTGTGTASASPSTAAPMLERPATSPPAASAQVPSVPSLGNRVGELLGGRPPSSRLTPAKGMPRVATPTQSQGFDPDLLRQLQQVVTGALANVEAGAAESVPSSVHSESPLSPPVRFQEPRSIVERRSNVDLARPPTPYGPISGSAVPQWMRAPAGPGSTTVPAQDSRRSWTAHDDVSPAARSVPGPNVTETAPQVPIVFGDGMRPIAQAIASRRSGSLALTTAAGVRRVVLHEGDVITAGSEIEGESLVHFLAGRGDLDQDTAARLSGKLAPSGRHAGAALIAQGFLAQDDLWTVLRAHAEWLLGRMLASGPGSLDIEQEAPGRLKAEPSVFGGAAGPEVFVEAARRVLDPETSRVALGGDHARLDAGSKQALLGECALSKEEERAVRDAPGRTVGEISASIGNDLLPVLHALVELSVLSLLAPAQQKASPEKHDRPDPLDDDAVRQRIKARLGLVREGDYFALLGIGRTATSYEIKRAYLELRRTLEPTRLLNATTADLYDDVVLVIEVLDEAYEILRDNQRRERYRRAIEAGPPGR